MGKISFVCLFFLILPAFAIGMFETKSSITFYTLFIKHCYYSITRLNKSCTLTFYSSVPSPLHPLYSDILYFKFFNVLKFIVSKCTDVTLDSDWLPQTCAAVNDELENGKINIRGLFTSISKAIHIFHNSTF